MNLEFEFNSVEKVLKDVNMQEDSHFILFNFQGGREGEVGGSGFRFCAKMNATLKKI